MWHLILLRLKQESVLCTVLRMTWPTVISIHLEKTGESAKTIFLEDMIRVEMSLFVDPSSGAKG